MHAGVFVPAHQMGQTDWRNTVRWAPEQGKIFWFRVPTATFDPPGLGELANGQGECKGVGFKPEPGDVGLRGTTWDYVGLRGTTWDYVARAVPLFLQVCRCNMVVRGWVKTIASRWGSKKNEGKQHAMGHHLRFRSSRITVCCCSYAATKDPR